MANVAATSSTSALDLLRPDPPIDKPDAPIKQEVVEEEEDELEALRQAALASMSKPKQPQFKVQVHPKRSNLLCIVVQDQQPPEVDKPCRQFPISYNGGRSQNPIQGETQRKDKFSRFESGSEDDEEEEEVEVETETEVEVTDSEAEEEKCPVKTEPSNDAEKRDVTTREDDADVLNVDCRDEVDEFSKFLNDFETELNDPGSDELKSAKKKTKKTKVIKKKKIVKRVVVKKRSLNKSNPSELIKTESIRASRSFSRSPTPPRFGRRYSRSPMSPYRRSPPMPMHRRRSRSPYRRGPSPYRRYSPPPYRFGPVGSPPHYRELSPSYRRVSPHRRPPSPPSPYRRYGSPPRRFRSPRGSIRFEPGRSEAGLKFSSHRGGSAPRSTPKVDLAERQHESDGNKLEVEPDSKSKSLPPKNETEVSREEEERQRLEKEEQKRLEFEERLRRLPTPDRERVLARRRKFESSQAVKAEKKVISLKCVKPSSDEPSVEEAKVSKIGAKKTNRQVSDEFGDAISLSVDDTLDMFEEASKKKKPMSSRIGKREDASKSITDLRLQLSKKRHHKRHNDDVNDSLEAAEVDTADEDSLDVDSGEKIRTALSGNRIVKPPSRNTEQRKISKPKSRSPSPTRTKKFVVPNTSSTLSRSIRARLGEQVVVEEQEIEVARKRKKTVSSGRSESTNSEEDSPTKPKKEKRKDKKEKKKKKEKKEKKEKRKKRKSKVSEEEEENLPEDIVDVDAKTGNSSDEELWGFFENMNKDKKPTTVVDKADILMDKMKKKNEERLRRIKEIEEDRRRHQ